MADRAEQWLARLVRQLMPNDFAAAARESPNYTPTDSAVTRLCGGAARPQSAAAPGGSYKPWVLWVLTR